MARKSKGKQEAKKKKAMRVDFFKLYGRRGPNLQLNEQEFRFTAIRRDLGNINIDRYVESCEWRDEGNEENVNTIPVLRGTITLRKPHPDSPGRIALREGHVIRCEVSWGGRWLEVWRMRIQKPTLAYADGSWTFELADDLALAARSEATFEYKRGKRRHKKGWFYHQIVKDICRRFRIPVAKLARGTERITNFSHKDISPLEAVRLAVAEEVEGTGRRLVIVWRYDNKLRRSGLNVLPMRRNAVLYRFRDQIRGADLTHERNAKFATALTLTVVKKDSNGKRRKVTTRVVDKKAVRKYGYIERKLRLPGTFDSMRKARRRAKRQLAKNRLPKRVIENFSHPGIAFVRRGDAVWVDLPEEGYKKKTAILFVVSANHALSSGDYTMTLTLGLTDPMDPNKIREEREKALRANKRKKRGKKEAAGAAA